MTEGAITQWKKKAGESFASGDVLLELETDKGKLPFTLAARSRLMLMPSLAAQIDVEAQEDGIMVKILVSPSIGTSKP